MWQWSQPGKVCPGWVCAEGVRKLLRPRLYGESKRDTEDRRERRYKPTVLGGTGREKCYALGKKSIIDP